MKGRPTRRELIDGLAQCYVALAALLPTHPACRDENMLKHMPAKKAREHRLIAIREDANDLVVRETRR
jgi:hypothetical protein